MTLEELIRDGLDVEEIPPGTAVILHARRPLNADELPAFEEQVNRVAETLGVKIAVVDYTFDVLLIAPGRHAAAVNGVPAEEEIRR